MKFRKRDIPKEIEISEGVYYKVKFKRGLQQKGYDGLCFYDSKEIWIAAGMDHQETASTLVHEALHAISHEHDIRLDHKLIYKVEAALAFFIFRNSVWIKWL
jgi:Zn-dependent peptidase ImmA (M78 family)